MPRPVRRLVGVVVPWLVVIEGHAGSPDGSLLEVAGDKVAGLLEEGTCHEPAANG
jgi:hypothetical protein